MTKVYGLFVQHSAMFYGDHDSERLVALYKTKEEARKHNRPKHRPATVLRPLTLWDSYREFRIDRERDQLERDLASARQRLQCAKADNREAAEELRQLEKQAAKAKLLIREMRPRKRK
jgi:small-conductance mechanosensitive channel